MKIFCIAGNYRKHCEEFGMEPEVEPVFFIKPETSLLRNHYDFYIPEFSQQIEYETEIVIKISKLGKAIDKKFASRYYDELTVGLDITARDIQAKSRAKGQPWFLSKGFDSSAPLGDFVPKTEFADMHNINFGLAINGNTVQQGNTGDMIHDFDAIVSYISQFVTLKTGDLIYTGTPSGVGPIKVGDHVEGWLEGTKVLEFNCR